jgi:hypothetical protein
MAQTLKE